MRIAVLPVERVAERIDDPADERIADRHAGDLAATADGLALLDELPVAEQGGADVVLLEVESDSRHAVLQFEQLEGDGVLEPVDAGDAVTDREDSADLGEVGFDVVVLDPLLEDRGDLFWAQSQVASSFRFLSADGVGARCGPAHSRLRGTSRLEARILR